jgi:hypothetical protein
MHSTLQRLPQLVLGLIFTLLAGSAALKAEDYGYFNVVNATGLEEPLQIQINGKRLVKGGMFPGEQAGGGMKLGKHTLAIQHPSCKETTTEIEMEKNKGMILIAYYIEEVNKETQAVEKQLIMQKAPRLSKRDQWRIGVVNSTREVDPLTVTVSGIEVTIPQYGALPVEGWKGGSVRVSYNGESILGSTLEERGAVIVVLSGSKSTKIRATLVIDVDYEFEFEKKEKKTPDTSSTTTAPPSAPGS